MARAKAHLALTEMTGQGLREKQTIVAMQCSLSDQHGFYPAFT